MPLFSGKPYPFGVKPNSGPLEPDSSVGGFVRHQSHLPGKGQNLGTVFQMQPVHDLGHEIFNRSFA